ncbi:hypothetical protein E2C01_095521 [Portunus trituberculatus]|uniref:Uncharacterized protein n=1 Tax=Portunus trituberculatus TaxID=210409 RepID=A0A5B7JVH3_PORTR|nr:hypothetical protein [Portunus trituberculatus]
MAVAEDFLPTVSRAGSSCSSGRCAEGSTLRWEHCRLLSAQLTDCLVSETMSGQNVLPRMDDYAVFINERCWDGVCCTRLTTTGALHYLPPPTTYSTHSFG